jgi:CRP-like cAMP-binding protein
MTVSAGQVLRSLPTFSGWSTEAINGLLQRARKVRFFAGDLLFREGEPGSSLFVVLEGQVRITLRSSASGSPGDQVVTLAEEGPGAILGEMSLIDPGPRSASATAVTPGTCLGLSASELEELQWDDPLLASALLRAFTRTLAARIRDADQKIGALTAGRADQRTSGVLRTLWMGAV